MNIYLRIFATVCFSLMFSAAAEARDYGRWLCTDCVVDSSFRENDRIPNVGEISVFIRSDVNVAVKQWLPGDTVTVCDGRLCVKLFYHASGNHMVLGPAYADSRSGYANVKQSSAVQTPPPGSNYASFSGMQITGHIESLWVRDNTSGNMYFVESMYVIDSILLGDFDLPERYHHVAN